jgi:hypothetical protein
MLSYDTWVSLAIPLVLLSGGWYLTRFPLRMTIAHLFCVPFAGTLAMVAVSELSKSRPNVWIVLPATLFFYLFGGLPLGGLWAANFGAGIWWMLSRSGSLVGRPLPQAMAMGAAIGMILGPPVLVAFFAWASLDPDWPLAGTTLTISLPSLCLQGALGGGVAGLIAAAFSRATTRPAEAAHWYEKGGVARTRPGSD